MGTTRALAVCKLLSAPVYGDRRCILPRCHLPVENTDTIANAWYMCKGEHRHCAVKLKTFYLAAGNKVRSIYLGKARSPRPSTVLVVLEYLD